MGWLLALVLLAALAAAPFIAERRRAPTTPTVGIADLPTGRTAFRWHGPEDGPVAVCIHGLTTPSAVFAPLADNLAAAGFRVLTYDLPGRGGSEPVAGPQDRAFFIAQLDALLADQGIDRIDLLTGYSMGGSIATAFTAATPDRVACLVLLAPAGLLHSAGPLAETVRRTPLFGDALMLTLGGALQRRGLAAAPDTTLKQVQLEQTRQRGFLPAVLSSQRHMLAENLGADHRAIRAAKVPTLAIWGEDDAVIPISNVGRLAEVNRDAHQATIPGATHALPWTHAPQIFAEITEFRATP